MRVMKNSGINNGLSLLHPEDDIFESHGNAAIYIHSKLVA